MSAFALIRLPAVLVLAAVLCGCISDERDMEAGTDLARAEEAQRKREYADAEMYFLRYLRKNPEGDNRWLVWNHLLDSTLHVRQDRRTAREYLEIMLVEFNDQDAYRRQVQLELADVSSDLRQYSRAVRLWEALVEDQGLDVETRAGVYRKLAKAYLRRLEFTVATDILRECLSLKLTPASHASCMYDLAEAQMLTDDLAAAEKTLTGLLELKDIPENQMVLAVFMLADVSEQLGKRAEAKELFESIRDRYPNAKVVDLRISYLNEQKKK